MKDFPTEETALPGMGRRGFLTLTSAGLFAPMIFAVTNRAAEAATAAPVMLGAYVQIGTDNTVSVVIGSTEMGVKRRASAASGSMLA